MKPRSNQFGTTAHIRRPQHERPGLGSCQREMRFTNSATLAMVRMIQSLNIFDFLRNQPYQSIMRLALLFLMLTGCSASQAIYVLPGEFTPDQEAQIQQGAELWNARVPAHEAINLVFGVTPHNPERVLMTGTNLGSPGWTWAERGITMIDTSWLARENGMYLLPAVAAHELAHLEGLHHAGGAEDLMYGVNSYRNMAVTSQDLKEWRRAH